MRAESLFFVFQKNNIWNTVLMYIEKQVTLFYHLHNENFEIRPSDPKLIIGILFWEKTNKNKKKTSFSTIGKAVNCVTITVMSCKVLIY